MAKEDKKDFNAMLHDNKDMPKVQTITDRKSIEKYGGDQMYFAPPIAYDAVMKRIPYGKVITVGKIREFFARKHGADFTEPITAGIFVSIAAWASHQREQDKTPYWRTLKADGELNPKYPGGVEAQKERLEAEGHSIIQKGRKNIRYYVKEYEKVLFALDDDSKDWSLQKMIKCDSLEEVRKQIDRIDEEIVKLIAERGKYVMQVVSFKNEEEGVRVPAREAAVIQKVRNRAEEYGADPDMMEALYREMIARFVDLEIEELRRKT